VGGFEVFILWESSWTYALPFEMIIKQSEEEAGFEMAVLQKKICVFFPVKGSKGSEGSKCLYSGRDVGS
jgi:hypothetical protein